MPIFCAVYFENGGLLRFTYISAGANARNIILRKIIERIEQTFVAEGERMI